MVIFNIKQKGGDKMNRSELARSLAENRHSIVYVNPSNKSYGKTYLIGVSSGFYFAGAFLVHEDTEQNAYDEICDYCAKQDFHGYFPDEEYLQELRDDALSDGHDEDAYIDEQFTRAGNEGAYFNNMVSCEVLEVSK
jgi:hypothetical protein